MNFKNITLQGETINLFHSLAPISKFCILKTSKLSVIPLLYLYLLEHQVQYTRLLKEIVYLSVGIYIY